MIDCRKVYKIIEDSVKGLKHAPVVGDGHRRKGIGPVPLSAVTFEPLQAYGN